jgi:hypothetical protein
MVYSGALNVVIRGEVTGTVDVWKCRHCGKTYADSRLVGEPKLPDKVGMNRIIESGRWGILVCDNGKDINWHMAESGTSETHSCTVFDECELSVDDKGNVKCSKNHSAHKFYFVEDKLNRNMVI